MDFQHNAMYTQPIAGGKLGVLINDTGEYAQLSSFKQKGKHKPTMTHIGFVRVATMPHVALALHDFYQKGLEIMRNPDADQVLGELHLVDHFEDDQTALLSWWYRPNGLIVLQEIGEKDSLVLTAKNGKCMTGILPDAHMGVWSVLITQVYQSFLAFNNVLTQ